MEKNKLDSLSRMDEQMRKIVALEQQRNSQLTGDTQLDPYDRITYCKTREFWNENSPGVNKVQNAEIDGPYGSIPFRLYYPASLTSSANNRCILYIHGGGFVVGSVDTHDGIMRRLANETSAVIAGINYRLAPEFKFPVQLDECVSLAEFLHDNGNQFGISGNDLSLAGDSAGAYLSLASALKLRDSGKNYIRSLLLYYGTYGLKDSISRRLYGGYWDGLTLESMNQYERALINPGDENLPYRNLFDCDLTYGIPPTYIAACELDPLRDDSILLYEILKEHKMIAHLQIFDGVIHSFLHFARLLPQSLHAFRDSAEFYANHT